MKSVPALTNDIQPSKPTFLGKILLEVGVFGDVFPAENIDHKQSFPIMPPIGANAEYGAYLGTLCITCHGARRAGGQPPDPASPPAPDLTQGGRLVNWSEAEFMRAMRSGVTPDGRVLDPEFMPWTSFTRLDDDELQAIWLHLQSLGSPSSE